MDVHERITLDPEVRSGKPCIKGTRIAVYDILEYLAGGMSEEEILADFPRLKHFRQSCHPLLAPHPVVPIIGKSSIC